jgi:hypothetical protein
VSSLFHVTAGLPRRRVDVGAHPSAYDEVTAIGGPSIHRSRSGCYTRTVKRAPGRPRPLDIVEVPGGRPDPRSPEPDLRSREREAGVTQKISREQLEEALKRTKSGTRRAVRSEPEIPPNDNDPRRERDSLPGPRDDEDNPHVGPQVTIVRIDSVEMDVIDPPSMPVRTMPTPMGGMMSPSEIRVVPTPGTPHLARKRFNWATERVHITPRTAFVAGLAVALFVLVAAAIGFFAGRVLPGAR